MAQGVLNKITGEYVYPSIANKSALYICPECDIYKVKINNNLYYAFNKQDSSIFSIIDINNEFDEYNVDVVGVYKMCTCIFLIIIYFSQINI